MPSAFRVGDKVVYVQGYHKDFIGLEGHITRIVRHYDEDDTIMVRLVNGRDIATLPRCIQLATPKHSSQIR